MAIGNLDKAIDEFVLNRMNDIGMNQPDSLSEAFANFKNAAKALRDSLPDELLPLFRECENAFSIFDAEIQETFYRAGFADAVRLRSILTEEE
ncbi:MAG: hypothetical protein IKS28_01385 [Clostridia bacterium]|nr:hypothetical protein [Clostridia bacterium]MBR6426457.1 hypothetical protein [Clostridia bacterium]